MKSELSDKVSRPWGCISAAVFGAVILAGCAGQPRMRVGAFFGSPGGMRYPDPANLGAHSYSSGLGERNGLAYTCRGGFIDIGHLREAADRTAFLTDLVFDNLISGEKEFSFRVIEPSKYQVRVSYPAGWEEMSEEERSGAAREPSILLGQYLAHRSLIWHEIITWYGFSSTGVFSEKISSFSFEDTYSDVTGVYLAGQALRDGGSYDEAMTELIDRRLGELGAVPPAVARQAVSQVTGEWYTGQIYIFTKMKEPSFDVGLADGYVSPRLVPGICSDAAGKPCPVPDLKELSHLGFAVDIEIVPYIWEKEAIYHSIQIEQNIRPERHFPKLIAYISAQAR